MIDKEKINVNETDGNFGLLAAAFKYLIATWIREINCDGGNFDFDSQDSYCTFYQGVLLPSRLNEKIFPEIDKEERQVMMDVLRPNLVKTIELYETYKDLFDSLNRQSLRLSKFREKEFKDSNKSDDELNDIFIANAELKDRATYYDSSLYKEVGFLDNNFHEKIYNYCIYVLSMMDNRFSSYDKSDENFMNIYHDSFFNMGVIYHVHSNFNSLLFEDIPELKLFKVLNLQNIYPILRINDKQKFMYLIYKLSLLLPNETGDKWVAGIIKEINISKKHYASKYKAVTWSNATREQKNFAGELDILFKESIAPLVS